MELHQKKELIEEAKSLLKANIFPSEIIQNIREKRLREDISNQIFFPKDLKKFEDLNAIEKTQRNKQLKIQLEFINYIHALDRSRLIALIYIITGAIFTFFAVIKASENLTFGLITLVEGAAFFVFVFDRNRIVKWLPILTYSLGAAVVIELILLGLPEPLLSSLDQDILANRRGAFTKMVNAVSPMLYISLKLLLPIFGLIYTLQFRKFFKLKSEFEAKI